MAEMIYEKICTVCGITFYTKDKSQRVCSNSLEEEYEIEK